jgi:pimeloyl-ACP methyl ester carboxylesterase
MERYDDDLEKFEAHGAEPLPETSEQGYVENEGARIWRASYGDGFPVILLHGGLGHSGNWGYQISPLVESGYRVVIIDSRGHGRSTRDARQYSYELMASDVLAVMDACNLERAALVGWSDGACIALVLASIAPTRVTGVFFFACNMDPSGVKPFEPTPRLNRCFAKHSKDYAQMSATPERFDEFVAAVSLMQRTQPNYSVEDLARIDTPVVIAQSENEEFIRREHAEFLAEAIPNADFVLLEAVSHFAPLQRPAQFNEALLKFLAKVCTFDYEEKREAKESIGSQTIIV